MLKDRGFLDKWRDTRIDSYFLCLDTKKVSKVKSRLKIFLGYGSFGCLCALQLSPDNGS